MKKIKVFIFLTLFVLVFFGCQAENQDGLLTVDLAESTTTGEELTSQKADESASHKEVVKGTEESPISTGEVSQNIKDTSITETISDRETNNKVTDIIKETGA